MESRQAIPNPFGVQVFGSSIVRVEPDFAVTKFTVSNVDQKPKIAFEKTRQTAQKVQSYLAQMRLDEVGMSRLNLARALEYRDGRSQFVGYSATIEFRVVFHNLDQVENILVGLVDLGVNLIHELDYQTTKLKEIRKQARQQAVEAARQKAQLYCDAAGVQLGRVLHIEDVNPDRLGERERSNSHEVQPETEDNTQAFNPASIVVGGAVMMSFEIVS